MDTPIWLLESMRAAVVTHAISALDGVATASLWLLSEHHALDDKTPENVLRAGTIEEISQVDNLLISLEYGMHV